VLAATGVSGAAVWLPIIAAISGASATWLLFVRPLLKERREMSTERHRKDERIEQGMDVVLGRPADFHYRGEPPIRPMTEIVAENSRRIQRIDDTLGQVNGSGRTVMQTLSLLLDKVKRLEERLGE
jgi:hypothetical protein